MDQLTAMLSKFLTGIIICLVSVPLFSQDIDSVLATMTEKSTIQKIRKLDDLAWDHMYIDYAKAFVYGKAANDLAIEGDFQKATASTYNTLGVVCRKQGLFEKSKAYYRKAGATWEALGIDREKVNVFLNLANVVRAQGHNDSALFYGNKGLALAKAINDSVKLSAVIVGLGNTYKNMGWNETAIRYYVEGSAIDQALGDTVGLAVYWSNIGDVLFQLKDYEEALSYYKETLAIDLHSNNKLDQSIMCKALGMTYQRLNSLDSALYWYNQGIDLAREIGDELLAAEIIANKAPLLASSEREDSIVDMLQSVVSVSSRFQDPLLEAKASLYLGEQYLKSSSLESALFYLNKANKIAQQTGHGTMLVTSHKKLAEAYGKKQSSALALTHLLQYVVLNDSMNDFSTKARIAELENKYELSSKDHQIAIQSSVIQQNELQRQGDRFKAGLIILILTILIALMFWLQKRKQYKTKIRYEYEKNKMKEEQIRAVIASQEKERKRFAMDLHDDFGQLISALKLNVSQAKGIASEKSQEILDNMYSALKNIAFDLMPHTLFEKGLEYAMDELNTQVNASGTVKMNFQSFETNEKLSGEQAVATYRIIQEVVSNILKYANAHKINISITDLGDTLSLMIEDDGNGFDLQQFKSANGNGWKNIHSRIELLGGEIQFDTLAGRRNSTVSIEIPYIKNATQTFAA